MTFVFYVPNPSAWRCVNIEWFLNTAGFVTCGCYILLQSNGDRNAHTSHTSTMGGTRLRPFRIQYTGLSHQRPRFTFLLLTANCPSFRQILVLLIFLYHGNQYSTILLKYERNRVCSGSGLYMKEIVLRFSELGHILISKASFAKECIPSARQKELGDRWQTQFLSYVAQTHCTVPAKGITEICGWMIMFMKA